MNLTKKQAEAAEWLIKYAADYPGLAQRKLAAKTPLHYNVFTRLMYSCDHKSWPVFLAWCVDGYLKQLIRGGDCEDITPEELREISAGLKQHRRISPDPITIYTRKRNGRLGKCTKCGTRREPRFYRPSGPVCLTCAGVHEAAGTTWNDNGEQVTYAERVQLEKVDGSRLRKKEVA